MRIAVIGAGHVGLVTGACLAEMGHTAVCVDNDQEKVSALQRGQVGIYEPGLPELVGKHLGTRQLSFTDQIAKGILGSDVVFICVGTPSLSNGAPDMTQVEAVSREIARHLDGYKVVAEKSTVPVNTSARVEKTLRRHAPRGIEFDVASVPEFLREGTAIRDFLHPDRVVLGVQSPRAEALLRRLFEPLGAPVLVTDIPSAEIIKHASNSFLALKISYINAVAALCESVGADVVKVAEGMGLDPRIGRAYLNAGVGYGGSCFPKDVAAFVQMAEETGDNFGLLKEVARINQEQPRRLVKKLRDALWVLRGKTVGVLGLSYKPDTDDLRNAPALEVIALLQEEGAIVQVYDPVAVPAARHLLGESVRYCDDPYAAAQGADALLLITEWSEFRSLDLDRLKQALHLPVFIDGRNLFDPQEMRARGFEYHGTGR
ncbi:MAG: UDP-glucose/GDP-mannose dehydrogenase family protein [Chloroflexi bacterium]|nr:UDP-glucose/GDP-mannose dehydrogenase family protein [Chloroflexota bacterium]